MDKLWAMLLPPLIDLINRKVGNSDLRFWISVAICSAVGIITYYFSRPLIPTFDGVVANIIAVFGWVQISYKGIYEGSKLQTELRGQ